MGILKTLTLAGLLTFTTVAHAAGDGDCSDLDVRESLGEPRDQGQTGWCFANTTADLLSQSVGHRVSAFDIATQFLLADMKTITASTDENIRGYLKSNPETIDRIEDSRGEGRGVYTMNRFLTGKGIYRIGGTEDGALLMSNVRGFCADEDLTDGNDKYVDYLVKIEKYRKNLLATSCLDPSLSKQIGEVRDKNTRVAAHLLVSWIDSRCQSRLQPKTPVIPKILYFGEDTVDFAGQVRAKRFTRAGAQKKIYALIDESLAHGKAAAISYSAFDVIQKPKGEKSTGDHSSIIAARKMINGQCHYFLRNSWGKTCRYKKDLLPLCEPEAGGVWVTPAQLPTLFGATTIR